ncbi:hypothetical protein J3R30DRAFT_3680069 [Lentinula aciculospora]|uniref:Uncharacterized protein n=1 Tax=Lentinula aciculospora TaxID=153920 RepID=A0A9W9AL83_9AGAR|nr:hypothetical protein J3R30DRAFT_3680069 [Lentinula aciculospora]
MNVALPLEPEYYFHEYSEGGVGLPCACPGVRDPVMVVLGTVLNSDTLRPDIASIGVDRQCVGDVQAAIILTAKWNLIVFSGTKPMLLLNLIIVSSPVEHSMEYLKALREAGSSVAATVHFRFNLDWASLSGVANSLQFALVASSGSPESSTFTGVAPNTSWAETNKTIEPLFNAVGNATFGEVIFDYDPVRFLPHPVRTFLQTRKEIQQTRVRSRYQGYFQGSWLRLNEKNSQRTFFGNHYFKLEAIEDVFDLTDLFCGRGRRSLPAVGVDGRSVEFIQAAITFCAKLGSESRCQKFWDISYIASFVHEGGLANEPQYSDGRICAGGSVGAAAAWVLSGGHSAFSPRLGIGADSALQFMLVTSSVC